MENKRQMRYLGYMYAFVFQEMKISRFRGAGKRKKPYIFLCASALHTLYSNGNFLWKKEAFRAVLNRPPRGFQDYIICSTNDSITRVNTLYTSATNHFESHTNDKYPLLIALCFSSYYCHHYARYSATAAATTVYHFLYRSDCCGFCSATGNFANAVRQRQKVMRTDN